MIGSAPYRSTVAVYAGKYYLGVRRSLREAAGVAVGDEVEVTLELDDAPRTIRAPRDLAAGLRADSAARAGWHRASYTRKKELHDAIEGAKQPETRARRVEKALEELRAPAPKRK